jgi:CBS domain-containing protein
VNVIEYCVADPAAVPLTATVAEAVQAMLDRHMGAAAVVDENGVVAGIFTERDVLSKVALSGRDPNALAVREVMTTPVIMATRQTGIAEALQTMIELRHRHLPVVEEDGRLIGILSIRHVLERKVDELTRQLQDSIHA